MMSKRKFATVAAASLAIAGFSPLLAQSADWQRAVTRLVASKQTYPRAAQMRGDEGTAKVKVTVGAGGEILSVELLQKTGSTVLDREAVELPRKIGRFPAPPGGGASIVLPMTWKMS